jgi:hypothetical protein
MQALENFNFAFTVSSAHSILFSEVRVRMKCQLLFNRKKLRGMGGSGSGHVEPWQQGHYICLLAIGRSLAEGEKRSLILRESNNFAWNPPDYRCNTILLPPMIGGTQLPTARRAERPSETIASSPIPTALRRRLSWRTGSRSLFVQ